MFKVYIGLKEIGTFLTFHEAVGAFIEKIREIAEVKNRISDTWLEHTNYIEHDVFVPSQNESLKCALHFSDTRDIAHRLGIMEKGRVVQNPPDVSPLLIDMIFLTVFLDSIEIAMKKFDEMKAKFQKEPDSPDNGSQIVYQAKIIKK